MNLNPSYPRILCVIASLATFHLSPSAALAQGSLNPPGAPEPVMKTLDQIKARTPISSAPFTITNAGSYYLTTNLTVATGNAINIATNGVMLDLNGFTIFSTASPASGTAIQINSRLRNIAILNGIIQGGVTNNNAGVYSGSGFAHGINQSGVLPANVRISQISVLGCLNNGIRPGASAGTLVESCTVLTVGGLGIEANLVRNSTASDCGGTAIQATQVSDSRGDSAGIGAGIFAEGTVNNSYGSGISGGGIIATSVQNSRGSSSSGTGITAFESATGSHGVSTTGVGLNARTAAFCTGSRPVGGTAIQATVANGCVGNGSTNAITYKYNMP